MSGHLFLGGPVHGELHEFPGTPRRYEVAVCPERPVVNYTSKDELTLDDPLEVTYFGYEPRQAFVPGSGPVVTVYVPAHLSKAAQWELVKVFVLGEVPEG